jgi:hypothetical protein
MLRQANEAAELNRHAIQQLLDYKYKENIMQYRTSLNVLGAGWV